MSKKARLPQSRRHILVYDEDWEWLDTHFGATSPRPIGVGPSCREIIHKHVQDIKAKFQEALDTSPEPPQTQPQEALCDV